MKQANGDLGLIDSAFEFSAPRYCNLSRELEEELRYEDIGKTPGREWFEQPHPLHEGPQPNVLEAVLSPSEWGDPLMTSAAVVAKVSSAKSASRTKKPAPSPQFGRSGTPKFASRTPQSGSARRVATKTRATDDAYPERETRRVLQFDEDVDEESNSHLPLSNPPTRRRDADPSKENRQVREVELLLRRHNRELEARKKEVRQHKGELVRQTRPTPVSTSVPSASTNVSSPLRPDPPAAATQKTNGLRVSQDEETTGASADDDTELKRMLLEHNRRVREAKRSQSHMRAMPSLVAPPTSSQGSAAAPVAPASPVHPDRTGHKRRSEKQHVAGAPPPLNVSKTHRRSPPEIYAARKPKTKQEPQLVHEKQHAKRRKHVVITSELATHRLPVHRESDKENHGPRKSMDPDKQRKRKTAKVRPIQIPLPCPYQALSSHLHLPISSPSWSSSRHCSHTPTLLHHIASVLSFPRLLPRKVEFTASTTTTAAPPVRRRRTDAHSELTELLKQHNTRVRTLKGRNTK